MLTVDSISKSFGGLTAVNSCSFTIEAQSITGLIGPNGAGKSTTMKVITGFLAPSAGTAIIDGFDITENPIQAKGLIGYLPEGAPCYGDMTTLEFLKFVAQIRGYRGEEIVVRVQHVLEEVELQSVSHQTIDTLSKGFKRRVGLAQAIMHDPKVLILDEPTDGLDPNQKFHVRELIKNLARDKIVIISTHILEEVTAVCTRAIIIAEGRILVDGTPAELEANSKYLHAVNIKLTDDYDLEADLSGIPEIGVVEEDPEDQLRYTILTKDGTPIFNKVSEVAQSKQWPVSEFHINRGELEDVFRKVTQLPKGRVA